ncbi:hypothetical protein GCM10023187_23080 [Nibrella viscosa]|uniref:Fatty acid desaturase domain-containing protein n=1 Tax=Nibrella viscosa TaxID=1084524 RepID=A0ABP8KER8_9BACT
MKVLSTLNDPVFVPKPLTGLDQFFLRFIKDERDLPFAYLTLKITLTLIPLGILLYMPFVTGWVWWAIAGVYLVLNNLVFKGPFGLMFHCTNHRQFFKSEYKFMNQYLPWVVGPFFGQSPETYYGHHIGMHHVENNMPEDGSSTMDYKRDSLREFFRYYANFMILGLKELLGYLDRKNRKKVARQTLIGELSFYALCLVLGLVNFPATLVVFIIPFFIFRLITMLGNWTQHSFVDPADPGNPYKNSITCINVKYNKKCWNDGYHISHHCRPAMHWTEHPGFFLKTIDNYAKNKAVVFDGLDFLKVFFYLMNKRYDVLARHVVNINGTFQSDEEVINLLKYRTQRIPVPSAVSEKLATA